MRWWLIGAVLIVIWVTLTFVLAIRSGWVHVPLGAALVFFARAVVESSATTKPTPE